MQPTAGTGGVVLGDAIPEPIAWLDSKAVDYRLAGVLSQIVHPQMNGIGLRISRCDVQQIIGELGRGAIGRHFGEMPSRLGLDAAENIGRSATPIFAIPTGHPPRLHSYRRPDFLMQNHRFLVDTTHW